MSNWGKQKKTKLEISRSPNIWPAFCTAEYTSNLSGPLPRCVGSGDRPTGLRDGKAEPGTQGLWHGIQLLSMYCTGTQCQAGWEAQPKRCFSPTTAGSGRVFLQIRFAASCVFRLQWWVLHEPMAFWSTAGLEGNARKHTTPSPLQQDANSREPNSRVSRLQL